MATKAAAAGGEDGEGPRRTRARARPATTKEGAGEPGEAGRPTPRTSPERLVAYPKREDNKATSAEPRRQLASCPARRVAGYEGLQGRLRSALKFDRKKMEPASRSGRARGSSRAPCSAGSARPTGSPRTHFAIRPAGRGAPKIDPKPILDGWKLLEATAIYRAAGKDPFAAPRRRRPGPPDVEGAAGEAGARRSRGSSSTPAAARTSHRGQIDRRIFARSVPRREGIQARRSPR